MGKNVCKASGGALPAPTQLFRPEVLAAQHRSPLGELLAEIPIRGIVLICLGVVLASLLTAVVFRMYQLHCINCGVFSAFRRTGPRR
jgi:hypothetical protein